ncbi:AraC family transcriptional regulator [Actinomadura violacea]|uniref:AraC family transcriptional regulator n=1 Tax=Actinomadura violacea TaxID=2819934 RepID=A0ABS3RJF7_9ACTN|nr:helix-turn-helix domain-containing protein [Actinomadura violacea]MBO2456868.1 AraC family transcriptional regulator [Actinomadura violacea]
MEKRLGFGVWQVPYAPATNAQLPVELLSFAELRAMDPSGRRRRPQRPSFHVVAVVDQGHGSHRADFVDHRLEPRTVVHLRPGVVHQWSDVDSVDGLLVLFTPAAIDAEPHAGDWYSTRRLREDEWALLSAAAAHLQAEYASACTPSTSRKGRAILRHALSAFVLRADVGDVPATAGEKHQVFRAYRGAVEEHFQHWRHVTDYATAIGYSPKTISRATMAAAGVNAKRFLDQRVIIEAKRILAHTDVTVGECSAILGFSQAANFTTFFTAHTGLAPRHWRERERQTITPSSP